MRDQQESRQSRFRHGRRLVISLAVVAANLGGCGSGFGLLIAEGLILFNSSVNAARCCCVFVASSLPLIPLTLYSSTKAFSRSSTASNNAVESVAESFRNLSTLSAASLHCTFAFSMASS
ncbi:hypothetical protein M427DRAFT_221348 [Gonapodya prolifera JEL478]|uniref:Uncharacterized protein n=1 Tax=Gonapodya prolifera (strain JEL478) TaxID=1344416 RepID=A0A139AN64_GONPJ|nr:hypothetical protein M427DRAFT_221348 [Gonapodya prolifera JEL478]|eukprot:KXS18064.1 hypothetical protein M427DRAFT_221348 [Gonapodya prolifera JEL478]